MAESTTFIVAADSTSDDELYREFASLPVNDAFLRRLRDRLALLDVNDRRQLHNLGVFLGQNFRSAEVTLNTAETRAGMTAEDHDRLLLEGLARTS